MSGDGDDEIVKRRAYIAYLEAERIRTIDELDAMTRHKPLNPYPAELHGLPLFAPVGEDRQSLTDASPPADKVNLFLNLFTGRADVYSVRYERSDGGKGYAFDCANIWKEGCGKKVKGTKDPCKGCALREYIPFDGRAAKMHLSGRRSKLDAKEFVAGAYGLLEDETCRFVVADFDKSEFKADADAFRAECERAGIPAHFERSRSGMGCHAWVFFTAPVSARHARRMMLATMTKTMESRPDIGFDSYDRLIPNQDRMPKGGLGNLIALPLQWRVRELDNTVFVDGDWRPHPDQWAYLSTARRMSPVEVERLSAEGTGSGTILGIQMPSYEDGADEPWKMKPSRPVTLPSKVGLEGKTIRMTFGDQVYIEREGLPSQAVAQFARLGAFQNPHFYKMQAIGKWTGEIPRIISAVEVFPKHIALPRGCLESATALADQYGATVALEDVRNPGTELPLSVVFKGTLKPRQQVALDKVLAHDIGVIKAPPGHGKTVISIAAIAGRRRNTLVIVFTKVVLNQWKKGLKFFLDIDPEMVGWIGGGKFKPTGVVDVALIHSLKGKDGGRTYDQATLNYVHDIIDNYGHIVVDEVHHVPALTFEPIIRRAKAKFHLAASATPKRSDGRHPLIFMNFGPIRYNVDSKKAIAESGMAHIYRQRKTAFRMPDELAEALRNGDVSPQELYRALAGDADRNYLIFDDVLRAMDRGRCPVVLSMRRDHIDELYERFKPFAKNVVVLRGSMKASEKRAAEELLARPASEERLILATGQYLGEGFDDARLDSLFLTMPTSWEGLLEQYAGRLQREYVGKASVEVTDYVDNDDRSMHKAEDRKKTFRQIGFTIGDMYAEAPFLED